MQKEVVDIILMVISAPVPYAILTSLIIFCLRMIFNAFSGKERFI